MKSSFVLFPNNLTAEHDRVNDMSQEETSKAYDCGSGCRCECEGVTDATGDTCTCKPD